MPSKRQTNRNYKRNEKKSELKTPTKKKLPLKCPNAPRKHRFAPAANYFNIDGLRVTLKTGYNCGLGEKKRIEDLTRCSAVQKCRECNHLMALYLKLTSDVTLFPLKFKD